MKHVFAAVLFFCAASASAQEVDLEKILITPYGFEESVTKTSASVSVITAADIKRSNAQSIPDVLKYQSNIDVKDYYGNGTKVTVDLRGFGEMSGQNTLVLVDGRRVNEIDLSGADWTQLPLDTVERIEVVRGKGAVLYGDNAAAGVVNIITKKGSGLPAWEAETAAGSYNFEKQRLALSGSQGMFSYYMNTQRQFTNGYRDNSDFSAQDLSTRLTVEPMQTLRLGLSGSYHNADYGMPGALRESQLRTRSRRDTMFPADTAGEKDWYTMLDGRFLAAEDISLDAGLSFRRRRLDNQQLTSQSVDGRRIDTIGFTPSATFSQPLAGKESALKIGYDLYRVDSTIDAYSYSGLTFYQGAKTRATDIDKDSWALYAQEQLSLTEKLTANAGYRYEKARYSFLSLPQDGAWTADPWWTSTVVNDRLNVKKRAVELGLSYAYAAHSSVFADYSRNFRLPTTDEYYSLWAFPPVNLNLKPQTADCYTLGINHVFSDSLKAKASVFTMSVRNELYYDPLTYTNTNYDKTRHRGAEAEVEYALTKQVRVLGGYAYTRAFFDGGAYNRNQIPMVPLHKVFSSVSYRPAEQWLFSATGRYCARQYFINDQAHAYTPLKDFATLDAKASYSFKLGGSCARPCLQGSVYAGVNNIFDARYSEYGAISTMYNEKGYYPAPGRNVVCGTTVEF